MKCYFKAFKNYFNCDGRASRKEYWLFILFNNIVTIVLGVIDSAFGFYSTEISLGYGYMSLIYMLVSICPLFCLQIRRFHDVGKSGIWWFCGGIPILSLYVFYLNCKAGDPGFNYYGAPSNYVAPKEQFKSRFTECPECGYIAVFEKECPKCGYVLPTEVQEDDVAAPPPIRYCRKCGAKLLEDAQHCKECGTEIITKVEGITNDLQ